MARRLSSDPVSPRQARLRVRRSIVYLGPEPGAEAQGELRIEGEAPAPGAVVAVARRRSPWADRPVERVIIGSHPSRSDVLLEGGGIGPEHVRLYLSREDGSVNDLRAIPERDVRVNGRPIGPHEWCGLRSGDELALGPWRFRFIVGGDPRAGEPRCREEAPGGCVRRPGSPEGSPEGSPS